LSIIFLLFQDILLLFSILLNIWSVQRLFGRGLKLQILGSRAEIRRTSIWLTKARFGTSRKGLIPDTTVQLDMFRQYYSHYFFYFCHYLHFLHWIAVGTTSTHQQQFNIKWCHEILQAKMRKSSRHEPGTRREFSAHRAALACSFYLNYFTIILMVYTIICIISKLETAIWASIRSLQQVGTSSCNTSNSGINPAQSKCPVQAMAQLRQRQHHPDRLAWCTKAILHAWKGETDRPCHPQTLQYQRVCSATRDPQDRTRYEPVKKNWK
jgi:hypothetical protein